jgi:hypothetical protein
MPLETNSEYLLTISALVQDLEGNKPSSDYPLHFTTGEKVDQTAPSVISVLPADGSTVVGVNAGVYMEFDEAINPLAVTYSTVQITDDSDTAVPYILHLGTTNRSLHITPLTSFTESVQYSLKIEGVRDLAGNSTSARAWSFTTGVCPDVEDPLVVGMNPPDGATDVPTNIVLALTVSEPIDPATIHGSSFWLADDYTHEKVAGNYFVSADGHGIRFVPDTPLAVRRRYRMSIIDGGIRDLAGNCIQEAGASFITGWQAFDDEAQEANQAKPTTGGSTNETLQH